MKYAEDDMIVCRCEEITVGEIRQAIREGARDLTGIKRRVRAGMGLCQGRTCEKLIRQILCQELNTIPQETGLKSYRIPVKPITFGSLAKGTFEDTLPVIDFEELKRQMGRSDIS